MIFSRVREARISGGRVRACGFSKARVFRGRVFFSCSCEKCGRALEVREF